MFNSKKYMLLQSDTEINMSWELQQERDQLNRVYMYELLIDGDVYSHSMKDSPFNNNDEGFNTMFKFYKRKEI